MGKTVKRELSKRDIMNHERKKRKRFSVFKRILAVAFAALFIVLILMSPIFDVTTIEINGTERITPQEVKNSGIIEDVNIFSVSSAKSRSLLMQNPYIKSVDIKKIYPDKIIVNIQERKERAYIEYPNMNTYIIVDETGMVLGTEQYITNPNLPIAVGISFTNIVIGETLKVDDPRAFDTLVTLSKVLEVKELNNVEKIDVRNLNDIHIYIGKLDVLLGDISEADKKISMLIGALGTGEIDFNDFKGTFDASDPNSTGFLFRFLK